MTKAFTYQKLRRLFKAIRPWLITLVLLVALRYIGALGQIQYATQSALMHTGVMDASTPVEDLESAFDYDFRLTNLQGATIDVNEFRGKVVFLNLWATWCGPCRVEMPSIQKLHASVANDSIVFVMLSLDRPEQVEKVKAYIEKKGFLFPVYMPAGPLPDELQVPSIPTTFVIGKDGMIKSKKVGTANYDTKKFRQFLLDLAAE